MRLAEKVMCAQLLSRSHSNLHSSSTPLGIATDVRGSLALDVVDLNHPLQTVLHVFDSVTDPDPAPARLVKTKEVGLPFVLPSHDLPPP